MAGASGTSGKQAARHGASGPSAVEEPQGGSRLRPKRQRVARSGNGDRPPSGADLRTVRRPKGLPNVSLKRQWRTMSAPGIRFSQSVMLIGRSLPDAFQLPRRRHRQAITLAPAAKNMAATAVCRGASKRTVRRNVLAIGSGRCGSST